MKVLITGSDGYIGVVLAQELIKRGHIVVGLDTGFYRSGRLFNGIARIPETVSKDIRKVSVEDLKGYDAVVHLAELSNDPLGQINPQVTFDVNHLGTVHLIEKCIKAGIKRFVYSSSCSVYGASDDISFETSERNPVSEYAKCKALNEDYILSLPDSDFTPVILRNATCYGFSPRMRFDLAINNLAAVAWISKVIKLESDGSAWRPFVHIEDITQAMVCALEAPKDAVYKQIFNVGDNDSNYKIIDIANAIKKHMPECEISLNAKNTDKRNYRVNFDKITTNLPGFKVRKNVPDGVKELLDVYKKVGLEKSDFESRDYTRLKQIEYLRNTGQIDEKFYWR